MRGTDGLALLKQGEVLTEVPPDWRDHVNVVSGRHRRTMPQVLAVEDDRSDRDRAFDELTGLEVPLDADHERLIDFLREQKLGWSWQPDRHMLVTHTACLKKAHAALGLKGPFETVSTGRDAKDINCFCFPLRNGAWVVRRYGNAAEAATWARDPGGYTRCFLNRDPDVAKDADEARDQRFSFLCDEAVAALEARPDLPELADAWGVSEQTTRLIGAGLREDLVLRVNQYMPTGRWAITVPLSGGGLTVGYVKLYPGEDWKSRLGWGSRPGLVIPWKLEEREGPVVVCGDPADTARALELGGLAVGLPEPTAPLDELASFLLGDVAEGRDVVVTPGADHWADETAHDLARLTGRPVKILLLPEWARGLRDCVSKYHTPEE